MSELNNAYLFYIYFRLKVKDRINLVFIGLLLGVREDLMLYLAQNMEFILRPVA